MNVAPPPLPTCSTCQTVLDANGACPRCRAPEDWNDQIDALDFVVRRLIEWHKDGQLTDRQLETLSDQYAKRRAAMASNLQQTFEREPGFPPRDECWSCGEYLYTSSSHCHECGAPVTHAGVRSLRYWRFLYRELEQLEESGWLTVRQAHQLLGDTQERIDALRRNLERERAPMVYPVQEAPRLRRRRRRYEDEPVDASVPQKTILEILLDPQSIQWLLAAGGALIVLGLIIWLTSLGLFENAGFVAFGLGLGNAALLGGGYALMTLTNHQNAGRALTLLACLVMPLNLWFYHTHSLLRLEDNLWIGAVVCCIIYTASALVLRDSLFVYILVGGITLTGLLILAQQQHFGEILAPVTFFIVLAMLCLHAERAFPPIESPFSRDRFGMAFYWSSQVLFGGGLLLLLGAQMVGWLHLQIFRNQEPFDVVNPAYLPWTLGLVLAGTYAYLYADLVVRKIGVYLYLAALTLLWAEIHVFAILDPEHNKEALIIITLALTALVLNVLQVTFREKQDFLRSLPPLGLLLSLLPVVFGLLLHLRATNVVFARFWPFEITWWHVLAMAVTALSCRAGAFLYRHRIREISILYFFATAAATLLFAAGFAWMIGVKAWEKEAPLIVLVPILYLVAAYLYREHTPAKPLTWCAHGAVAIMLIVSIWTALELTPQLDIVGAAHGVELNLFLALFFLELTIFYGLATFVQRNNVTMYLAAVMLCGAVWQLMKFFQTPDEFYVVAFALGGFLLLVLYRLGVFEKMEMPSLERGIFQSANALTTLGFASGALLSLARLLHREEGEWRHTIQIMLAVLSLLTVISLLSAWLVQHQIWRRVHIVFTIANGLLLVLMIHKLSTLSPWQRLEIFSVVLGLILLAIGYAGWYRETERASDLISVAFFCGSVALLAPLLIASGIHLFARMPFGLDELGLIAGCIALFASGVVCRIKALTIISALAMVLYVLLVFIYMHRFLTETVIIGVYLTFGGALLFGTGLILSVYRDRLLGLPAKIRRREGIFSIFDWR